MKIELKNIKTFEGHDGIGLNADLFVDGVKTAHIFDSAHGGGNEYQTINREKMKELEEWVKQQPETNHFGFTCKYDLDILVDELCNAHEKQKEQKTLAKKYATAFVWGKPNGVKYQAWGFKSKTTLVGLSKTGQKQAVQNLYDKVKAELKEGETIWNTNLAELEINL